MDSERYFNNTRLTKTIHFKTIQHNNVLPRIGVSVLRFSRREPTGVANVSLDGL